MRNMGIWKVRNHHLVDEKSITSLKPRASKNVQKARDIYFGESGYTIHSLFIIERGATSNTHDDEDDKENRLPWVPSSKIEEETGSRDGSVRLVNTAQGT